MSTNQDCFYLLLERKKKHRFEPEGTYAQVFERFRVSHDLTKSQMATLLGTSGPAYSKMLGYGSKPTPEVIANAVRLGMKVDSFLNNR